MIPIIRVQRDSARFYAVRTSQGERRAGGCCRVFRLCGFRLSAAVVLGELALPSQCAPPHASGTRWAGMARFPPVALLGQTARPMTPDPGGRGCPGPWVVALAVTPMPSQFPAKTRPEGAIFEIGNLFFWREKICRAGAIYPAQFFVFRRTGRNERKFIFA